MREKHKKVGKAQVKEIKPIAQGVEKMHASQKDKKSKGNAMKQRLWKRRALEIQDACIFES